MGTKMVRHVEWSSFMVSEPRGGIDASPDP
jgi:hypothetical protein